MMASRNGQKPPLCGLSEEQVDALQTKLDPANVRRREGKFDYIEAHHAIREANRIFGPAGWVRDSGDMRCVFDGEYAGKGGKTGYLVCYTCRVTVRVRTEEGWIASDGWGYGESIGYSSPGQCHEGAIKEAESDAMKRALVKFGDPFGLALYDKEREYVGAPEPAGPPPGYFDEQGRPLHGKAVMLKLREEGIEPDERRLQLSKDAADIALSDGSPKTPEQFAKVLETALQLVADEKAAKGVA
jgi:hypothetical protein